MGRSNHFNPQATIQRLLAPIKLPVVDALLDEHKTIVKEKPLKNTAIFYVHHPLQTSINIVDALLELGVHPTNTFILGKRYSECDAVVQTLIAKGVYYQPCSTQNGLGTYSYGFIRDINWMWQTLIEHVPCNVEQILILDHGGHAITFFPSTLLEQYKVLGIEKTTAGFFGSDKKDLPPIPLIDVANAAAKRHLESPLIAEAVVNKILSHLPQDKKNHVYGVIGLGSIGQSIIKRLAAMGCQVIAHDVDTQKRTLFKKNDGIIYTNNLAALISSADYIFGCSGQDVLAGHEDLLRLSSTNKTLISCSSEDKEFLSFLRLIKSQMQTVFDPLDHIEYRTALGAYVNVLRGGFPVNFDHSGESVPANDIQLTRALVIAAVIQAIKLFQSSSIENKVYELDAGQQRFIVHEWMKYHQDQIASLECLQQFSCDKWILDQSKIS